MEGCCNCEAKASIHLTLGATTLILCRLKREQSSICERHSAQRKLFCASGLQKKVRIVNIYAAKYRIRRHVIGLEAFGSVILLVLAACYLSRRSGNNREALVRAPLCPPI